MNYISAKQFKNQSEKVQQVLLDWWKPEQYELVQGCQYKDFYDKDRLWNIGDIDMNYVKNELKPIPLFTESQLRLFLEEHTGNFTLIIIPLVLGFGYQIISEMTNEVLGKDKDDLLQAYWKAVIKVIEEL